MNKFVVFPALLALTFARPDGLLDGNDGLVSVTQNSLGTYKYKILLKDSSRSEERLEDGTIFGEYTIPGPDGVPQTFKYTSGIDGFRILDGPLPVAPVDTAVPVSIPEVPIQNVRSDLEVPTVENVQTFVHSLPVPVVNQELPLPVDYTPEVKAAREQFFAVQRAEAAREVL